MMRNMVEKMVVLTALVDAREDEEAGDFSSFLSGGAEDNQASEDETDFELTCALALATLKG